jgi:4-hydroxyproline epimerase
MTRRIQVVDSHTAGEPTRLVLAGGPDLGGGSLAEQRRRFQQLHDDFRSLVVHEPRGSDVLVGALLCPSPDPTCATGVLFFNNVGVLNMCGHGLIGVVATLAYLGRLGPGMHRFDTPVGVVPAELHADGRVSIHNVLSYRLARQVPLEVPGLGRVHGDVAWGGNWFFLVHDHALPLELHAVERLTAAAWTIRQALATKGITGQGGAEIDHIELLGPAQDRANQGRAFVLCPGKAYDRSPCGTGTSAKLACLAAEGQLRPGEIWRQESILGTVFEARYAATTGGILPTITAAAHVTAESTLLVTPGDPFPHGIRLT